jgi:hypothetical protein
MVSSPVGTQNLPVARGTGILLADAARSFRPSARSAAAAYPPMPNRHKLGEAA